MNDIRDNDQEEIRLDLNSLSEKDLDELARLIVRKLRTLMRQESDRMGRS